MKLYLFVRIVGKEDPEGPEVGIAADDESYWCLVCATTPKQAARHAGFCAIDQPKVFKVGQATAECSEGVLCSSNESGNGAAMLHRLKMQLPWRYV